MNRSHIYLLTVAVLLLTALTLAWMNDDNKTTALAPSTTEETPTETEVDAPEETTSVNTTTEPTVVNSILLAENETGMEITVAAATLTQPGYVAVFRKNSQGEVRSIGNSDLLEAGQYTDIAIQVEAPVAKEQQIIAVLYTDDGDGEIELNGEDTFLTNASGSVVLDIDVIDTDPVDEPEELEAQAQELME